ncbi:hypothetical protein [Rhizobium rhizogenes]|uniref:hypothetical protein n=1 Tax=Rhizobium rhizogenes TaxID=359 RepID=UPI0024BE4BF2|nr:hypothetical protein [Rhizobium rhizogenes]MDJ1632654.1 hypothetical protein [Rhizobium rhizogenes]
MFNDLRKLFSRAAASHRIHVAEFGDDRTRHDNEVGLVLAAYRKKLMRQPISGRDKKKLRISKRRYAKDRSRKALKSIRTNRRPQFTLDELLYGRFIDSRIVSSFKEDRRSDWVPLVRRRPSRRFAAIDLKDFSFIDHPQVTLDKLAKIAEFECHAVEAQLHFDDHYCLDIGPYLVLAEMWPQLAKVFRGGRMGVPVQKVIDALGLRRDLTMQLRDIDQLPLSERQDVWAFPRRTRRPAGSSRDVNRNLQPQVKEKVADEFCDMLNDWFGEATKELVLKKEAKSRLANIFGELLDNAERHSSDTPGDGTWSTAAFMARRIENGTEVYRCHMAFLSVGRTIAEGLDAAPASIRDQISEYCERHKKTGISRETLSTLVALQDGVTRDADAVDKQRGGVGLQDIMQIVNIIGLTNRDEEKPKMTIVSGHSCIQARQPYLQGSSKQGDDRRFLWFNSENRPEYPPDERFVFDLVTKFPGTIIGITFVMSKEALLAVLNADDRTGTTDKR